MTVQTKPEIRQVDDVSLHGFRNLIQVRFKDEMEVWWPILIDDIGKRLRKMKLIDFYVPETQQVGVEQIMDMVYDRETRQHEPVYKVVYQDIRRYLEGCTWEQYAKIFSSMV